MRGVPARAFEIEVRVERTAVRRAA